MRQLFFIALTPHRARRNSALTPRTARRNSAGASSAGAGIAGSETKRKNSKTSDMSESVSSSLSEVLFFLSERPRQSATRTKRRHCSAARCVVQGVPAPRAAWCESTSRRALQAEVKRSTSVRSLVIPAPEVAGEEDDDGEEFQSADDHERAQIDLQGRVEEREVPGGRAEAEGCACV